jgi:two-component system, cell cycle sensor histidine kinase and response regulator CckA
MTATILVVDDEPTVLSFVSKVLERAGYEVLGASSADQAAEICEQKELRISIVVTDIQMPGVSGRKLAECLSRSHPNIPVLFMTGYIADTENCDTLTGDVRLDGYPIIRKPFGREALLAAIEGVLLGKFRSQKNGS